MFLIIFTLILLVICFYIAVNAFNEGNNPMGWWFIILFVLNAVVLCVNVDEEVKKSINAPPTKTISAELF